MRNCLILLTLTALSLPGQQPDRKQRAAELLEQAAGMVSAGSAEFQPGALLQLGLVEASRNKARAAELLLQSIAASAVLPTNSGERVREEFQSLAVRELAKVDLEAAIEALPMLTPLPAGEDDPRVDAVEAVVASLLSSNHQDRAVEVIERHGLAGAFPYAAVTRLLQTLPADDPRRDLWFAQSLAAFQQNPNLAAMDRFVREFRPGRKLPMSAPTFEAAVRAMVRAALDARGLGQTSLTITAASGTVHLTNTHDVALFSLVDLALAVDPSLLDRMKEGRTELRAALEAYPRGRASLDAGDVVTTQGTIIPGLDEAASRARMQRLVVETMKFQEVMANIRKDPARSIAAARQIPTARLAVRAFGTIAMSQNPESPASMLAVIRQCAAGLAEVKDEGARASGWTTLAQAAQRAKDEALARDYLLKGLDDARHLYEQDADAEQPNIAPRPLWPSAAVFRALCYRAAHLLGGEAEAFLEKIPDAELATLARIEIAAAWLGAPSSPLPTRVMRPRKR